MLLRTIRLIIVILFSLPVLLPPYAGAQDASPAQVLVNYAEPQESGNEQQLNVYFTLLDAAGRAITAPQIDAAQIVINNQTTEAQISVPDNPLYIALVLDASGSMRAAAGNMRQAAIEAVNAAPQGTRFSVIQFNEEILVRIGFTEDRGAVINAIGSISDDQFQGGTCLYDATYDATVGLQNAGPALRRAVILFTDGRDELIAGGELDPCSTRADYSRLVEQARNPQGRVPLFTIGLSGSQAINQTELEAMSAATGGLSAFGGVQQLNALFQQIIQALGSQRLASASLCVESGTYGGFINIGIGSGNLSAPIPATNFTSSCVIPTDTPTPRPLSLSVGTFRFDPETNELVFEVDADGDLMATEYEITIIDRASGFQIEGDFGQFSIPAADNTEIRVPIAGISAPTWIVNVSALDEQGRTVAQASSNEIMPPRTPTPTPSPTSAPTATPTAVIPGIDIGGIEFDAQNQAFVVDLETINVDATTVSAYTIRIEDERKIQVFSQTQNVAPPDPLRVAAVNDDGRNLPAGKYTLIIELRVTNFPGTLRVQREVTRPEPPAPPSPVEQMASNISTNPTLAIGLVILVLVIFIVLFILIRRRGRGDKNYYENPVFGPSDPSSRRGTTVPNLPIDPEMTLGDKGGKLTVVQADGYQAGYEWDFNNRNMPYRIGNGGLRDYPVKVNIPDPGMSKLHAAILFDNGRYQLIDEGSQNGTYLDDEPLVKGRRYSLSSGQIIRFGLNTRLRFTDKNEDFKAMTSQLRMPSTSPPVPEQAAPPAPYSGLPPGISAEITIEEAPAQVQTLQPGMRFEVSAPTYMIGRSADSDLVIDTQGISRNHARLYWENGYFMIEDLGSVNGTMVNQVLLTAPFELESGQEYTLMIGKKTRLKFFYRVPTRSHHRPADDATSVEMAEDATSVENGDEVPTMVNEKAAPEATVVAPTAQLFDARLSLLNEAGQEVETRDLTEIESVLGRSKDADWTLDNPGISRLHLRLYFDSGQFFIKDLGSSNGTMLNGDRLEANEPQPLEAGTTYSIILGVEPHRTAMTFVYTLPPPYADIPPDDEDRTIV